MEMLSKREREMMMCQSKMPLEEIFLAGKKEEKPRQSSFQTCFFGVVALQLVALRKLLQAQHIFNSFSLLVSSATGIYLAS